MIKRFLSVLLILAMVLAVLPHTAFADEQGCAHEHTVSLSKTFSSTKSDFCYMLWMMAGKPEPTIENPYTDIQESDPFYKAALWGYESKICPGGTETTFNPTINFTRAQAVTKLWRFAGKPAPKQRECTYIDVRKEYDYYEALLWASETDWIDLGIDKEHFRGSGASGELRLEGTVCEDCDEIIDGLKVSFIDPITAEGTFGENLHWKIIYGTMTITGTGEMPDVEQAVETPWNKYTSNVRKIVLPDGLVNIGSKAFEGFSRLQSIVIPDSVVSIGTDAFRFCTDVAELTLPDGLQFIGDGAFVGIEELKSVTIPGSVVHIGNKAFASCGLLRSVTISEGVLSLGDLVFQSDMNLKTANIPKSVVHLGENPFSSTGLTWYSSNWENNIMYFDDWALEAGPIITEAQIKAGTRGIADKTFYYHDHLKKVVLPDSLNYIGFEAFAYTNLESVKLPADLQCIYGGAFAECIYLREMNIPDGVEYLGEAAFFNCCNLKSATISKKLTELSGLVFGFCEDLKSMEIPESVELIGEHAFYGCNNLKRLTIVNRECDIRESEENPALMLGFPGETTIYGYAGSTAEEYADKYDYRFIALSEKVPFIDVPAKVYYENPVAWAVENEITKGTDDTHFGSNDGCTRGQVVTFLWRAAGCPEPEIMKTSFTDVKPGAFYEKAVAWAVEQGITNGQTDTLFAPNAKCNRGQIVTFLWRYKGKPIPNSTETMFEDLKPGGYYLDAVAWAVENEVTNGLTSTTFAPDDTCSRGQVVTFLYRALAGE